MKFGVREICDVVLRAKSAMKVGDKVFYKNEPVLYFDSLKTSSMESQVTTVYAQGGRGNARLIAWEGERTVTFTMEDALLSPEGFSILTGAGLVKAEETPVIIHKTEITNKVRKEDGYVEIVLSENPYIKRGEAVYNETTEIEQSYVKTEDLEPDPSKTYYIDNGLGGYDAVDENSLDDFDSETYYELKTIEYDPGTKFKYWKANDKEDFIYVMLLDDNGDVCSEPYIAVETLGENESSIPNIIHLYGVESNQPSAHSSDITISNEAYVRRNDISKFKNGCSVLVDYYVKKDQGAFEINITPDKFGGNFYLEASTLFRDTNGTDLPAEFIIPNCKIQSNFTFTMASSGDPSTFTFTMDAFPDYTRWNKQQKVFATIQVIEQGDALENLERLGTSHNYKSDEDYNPFLTFVREQEKYLLNSNEEPEEFNNAIFSSVDENGDIYNNGLGYKKKTWIYADNGDATDALPLSEYTATGFIPYNDSQIINITGFKIYTGQLNQGIGFYDEDKAFLAYQKLDGGINSLEYSKDNLDQLPPFRDGEVSSSNIAYIRVSFYNSKLSELEITIKDNPNLSPENDDESDNQSGGTSSVNDGD